MTVTGGIQTSVGVMGVALAGMKVDASRDENVSSRTSEEASALIPFGVFVAQGTTDLEEGMLLLAAITDKLAGATVRDQGHAIDIDYDADGGMMPHGTCGAMTRGRLWIVAETSFTASSDVHIRAVATGDEVAGSVRSSADGTDTIDASAFCRVVKYDAASGLVALEFDINNRSADKID